MIVPLKKEAVTHKKSAIRHAETKDGGLASNRPLQMKNQKRFSARDRSSFQRSAVS